MRKGPYQASNLIQEPPALYRTVVKTGVFGGCCESLIIEFIVFY